VGFIRGFLLSCWGKVGSLKGAKITLQPTLEGLTDYRLSTRAQIVQSLANFRCEWQMAVEGRSLLDTEAPVGLILADIAERLELSPQERHAMPGGKLVNQVDCLLEERIAARLSS
jgi:hypothetical protein